MFKSTKNLYDIDIGPSLVNPPKTFMTSISAHLSSEKMEANTLYVEKKTIPITGKSLPLMIFKALIASRTH